MLRYPKSLALAAGLASAIGFEPLGLWPATLLAFALLMHLVAATPDMKGALLRGWLFGVGHFALGLNWIAHAFTYQDKMPAELGYGAVVALSLYLAVYPAAAAGLAWRWGKRPIIFVLFFAAAWTVTEWLRATVFTGFAWNPLGVAMVVTPLAPAAKAIGTYGLSALAALFAGGLWLLAMRRWMEGGLLLAALAVRAAWSFTGPAPVPAGEDRPLVRIVQPNIGQEEKHREGSEFTALQRLARLSGEPGAEPRLLFWPEAAIDNRLRLEEQPELRAAVASLLGPRDILLTGGIALVFDEITGEIEAVRNSMFVLDANAQILGRYDKAHLVPYGEYLPMRPILSAIGLSRLVPGDLDFLPGPGPVSFELPGFGRVGVQICYEIIFSGEVASDAERPDFIFNPSNDAWFGSWGPPQHLAQARLRAIEEGLPVVRSTPTGISALIDADGRVLDAVPHETAGVIEARLPAPRPPTLFARFGNLLSFGFALLLAAIGVAIGRRAR